MTAIAHVLADQYFGKFLRSLSLLSTLSLLTLFLPQNSNPLQMPLTGRSPGPLSAAQANVHPDSTKLSTVIGSVSIFRFLVEWSDCVSGTSRSELRH